MFMAFDGLWHSCCHGGIAASNHLCHYCHLATESIGHWSQALIAGSTILGSGCGSLEDIYNEMRIVVNLKLQLRLPEPTEPLPAHNLSSI